MIRLACVAIGYVFGLFQTGYIYGELKGTDIRQHGSGNAGATNALRTLGWKAGLITLLGDCFKCVFAVLLGMYAALGVILGHNFPFYLKFKGGK
ncbi:MAG: glycerol-3-phosphate acyltransferase, partial [Lachnospiraceae bacterium]|nr:glycerol-3-phosphate acyltransferase [Lachnospiraceae bacterium]